MTIHDCEYAPRAQLCEMTDDLAAFVTATANPGQTLDRVIARLRRTVFEINHEAAAMLSSEMFVS